MNLHNVSTSELDLQKKQPKIDVIKDFDNKASSQFDAENMLQQTFVIPALLIFFLSIPLITEIVPPNCGYGIRTPKTLSEPRIWYRANKFAGRLLMFASGFYLTVVVLTIHLPSINQNFGVWLLHFGSFMIPLLVSLLFIRRYIKNL